MALVSVPCGGTVLNARRVDAKKTFNMRTSRRGTYGNGFLVVLLYCVSNVRMYSVRALWLIVHGTLGLART